MLIQQETTWTENKQNTSFLPQLFQNDFDFPVLKIFFYHFPANSWLNGLWSIQLYSVAKGYISNADMKYGISFMEISLHGKCVQKNGAEIKFS
jgi:hypothetical protein